MRTIRDADITYKYNAQGYTIYYKGEPILGAGLSKRKRATRSQLSFFKECAEHEKQCILGGNVGEYTRELMRAIDREKCE